MELNLTNISKGHGSVIEGTIPAEVFTLTFFVPLCSLIIFVIANTYKLSSRTIQVIEVFALNLSLLLALTVLNNVLLSFLTILGIALLKVLLKLPELFSYQRLRHYIKNLKYESIRTGNLNSTFVEGYRGHLLLATSISILAVDFKFFPTRFAKTETYGWSIMDAGVGSFILLHGLCSSHGKYPNLKKHGLRKCFLSSLPLFFLGLARLIATTAVGYHKVVPEYGVHWNFFFTLAFTKMICYTILDAFAKAHPGILAIITVSIHQLLLSKAGLTLLVLSDARTNLFEANKEGICSLLGFISLYFCGVQLGRVVWKQGDTVLHYAHLLRDMFCIGICSWILMYIFHASIQAVSRRMANLPYCIWVVSLTCLQLAVHLGQELLIIIIRNMMKINLFNFLLWKAINYNGLAYFLLGNLLTGLVNLLINTNDSSNLKALVIMLLYLTILTGFSVITYKNSIQLKLW